MFQRAVLGLLLAVLVAVTPAFAASPAARPNTLYVEVQGSLQGMRNEDLPAIFAAAMARAKGGTYRFEPAPAGQHPANRVVWLLTPGADGSGSVRTYGFSRAMMARLVGSSRVIAVQASLYLNNTYETMVSGQVRDTGDAKDEDFVNELAELTRQLIAAVPLTAGRLESAKDSAA